MTWIWTRIHWIRTHSNIELSNKRLKLISAQDALILLKSSFSAPRVLHLLRCSPSVGHTALGTFDQLLRTVLSSLTNSDLSDSEWSQATLPVKDGVLGSDGCLCLHFLPFWLQRPSVSRMRSFSTVSVDQTTLLWSLTCLYGRRALEHSQQAMLPINRQRGIDLALRPLRTSS